MVGSLMKSGVNLEAGIGVDGEDGEGRRERGSFRVEPFRTVKRGMLEERLSDVGDERVSLSLRLAAGVVDVVRAEDRSEVSRQDSFHTRQKAGHLKDSQLPLSGMSTSEIVPYPKSIGHQLDAVHLVQEPVRQSSLLFRFRRSCWLSRHLDWCSLIVRGLALMGSAFLVARSDGGGHVDHPVEDASSVGDLTSAQGRNSVLERLTVELHDLGHDWKSSSSRSATERSRV